MQVTYPVIILFMLKYARINKLQLRLCDLTAKEEFDQISKELAVYEAFYFSGNHGNVHS